MSASNPSDLALITAQLLDWHIGAGVDEMLDDAPHDRFAEGQAEREARGKRPALPSDGSPKLLVPPSASRVPMAHVAQDMAQATATDAANAATNMRPDVETGGIDWLANACTRSCPNAYRVSCP